MTIDVSGGGEGSQEDRCHNCQTPLAPDQRYCVNCGERRGKSRYSMSSMAAQVSPPPPPAPPKKTGRKIPAGVTLVTGVATLLLAMGVGVLIGHDSSSSPQPASQGFKIVTVGGGAATTASTGGTALAAHHAKSKKGKSSSKTVKANVKATVVKLNKKTVAQAVNARQKVFGQSHNNLAPPTVQPGQKCTHGAGCQGGKFTGNFFPGG